ncbi:MAG: fumarylacetoacetate hydrolase family protein [Pseudomonadota bacterium]
MKLITFEHEGNLHAGILNARAKAMVSGDKARHAIRMLIEGGEAALASWAAKIRSGDYQSFDPAEITLKAPIPEPRRDIICVGKNYHAHAAEFHKSGFDSTGMEATPSHPVIFTKATTSVIGPEDPICAAKDPTATVDYEGELGVVIGETARNIRAGGAFSVIMGYTIINDVTSRELQKQHNQWFIGKGIDSFCPMGPYILTADELCDVTSAQLTTDVNGERRQDARLKDLIFDIPTLIETITATTTLLPGDIIATGTPAGVGIGFDPPRYLTAGDRVDVTISGLGTLSNPVQ